MRKNSRRRARTAAPGSRALHSSAMKIYTKTGDAGDTGLFGGGRVPKSHPRVEAYGDVDELNAVLGVVRAAEPMPRIDEYSHSSSARPLRDRRAARHARSRQDAPAPREGARRRRARSRSSSARSTTATTSSSRCARSSSPAARPRRRRCTSREPSAGAPSAASSSWRRRRRRFRRLVVIYLEPACPTCCSRSRAWRTSARRRRRGRLVSDAREVALADVSRHDRRRRARQRRRHRARQSRRRTATPSSPTATSARSTPRALAMRSDRRAHDVFTIPAGEAHKTRETWAVAHRRAARSPASDATPRSSRSAAEWSATSPASLRRRSCAAFPTFRFRPVCSR